MYSIMIADNKHKKVGDVLKAQLQEGSKVAVVSAMFSIHAFNALKKEFSKVERVRLIFSNPLFSDERVDELSLEGTDDEIFQRNRLDQWRIAKECAKWLQAKVDVKEVKHRGVLPTNLFYVKNDQSSLAIQGTSDFTLSGFGYAPTSKFSMNTLLTDSSATQDLLRWFDDIWSNETATENIKQELLKRVTKIYEDKSPEFLYFVTLYSIFKEFLGDLDEDKIIKTKTGFKETLIWKKLYNFQRDGVVGAIDKLEKYNGCILADSVGLGKTFEALAIIKYYELRNDRVLVLCPKKLRENWTIYTINDKRNIFAKDRFNFDVLNHTDLTRENGFSGEINLETINWENYDLVVIDESHNFRNNNPRKDGVTRYSKLMNEIVRAGVRTKVLMLSATPVNNRLADLKNQLAFITEGRDDAFATEGITSIERTLTQAQKRFNRWLDRDDRERTLESLLESLNFDYFKLLDLVTIARSRKHIEKYYNIDEIGKFPERKKPINIKADIDIKNEFPPLLQINRTIRKLTLAAYSPFKYIRPEKREIYNKKYDIIIRGGKSVFRQIDREENLIHLLRVNILKRMESSINSFAITLERLLAKVEYLLSKLEKSSEIIDDLNILDIDMESDEYSDMLIGNNVKVLIQDIDPIRWREDLEDDRNKLIEMLHIARAIDASRDAKLAELKRIIQHKVTHPFNPNNKKVLIFTAFADTAQYLYEQIANWAQESLGIHSALVSGSGTNKTTYPTSTSDMNAILINFSPKSKERNKILPDAKGEIDILIATDCISEGQNLQDCDFLINYDIHWNPVRIIQRFGRIDRIGSSNDSIQLVNFWPNMELDEYINLEARVSGRMVLLDVSATGEENVIEINDKKRMNDLEYRRRQLKQLQETVLDLEDIQGNISITDLTLNDFRMDLMGFLKDHATLLEQTPKGIHAVVQYDESYMQEFTAPGAIFCLKARSSKNRPVNYALDPYYLVYVNVDGSVRYTYAHTKKILDIYKKLCKGQSSPISKAVEHFKKLTKNGRDMHLYQNCLKSAIESITEKKEQDSIESLFTGGGTSISADHFKGIDEFEVITFLVVL